MIRSQRHYLVLVTAPNIKTARQIARAALQDHLTACANLLPRIESHYWWQAKLETSAEVLLLLKTTRAKLSRLEQCILSQHPYDTPEFIVLPIQAGNQRYLRWIDDSVA